MLHMGREPKPSDGPEYHENHAAWERRTTTYVTRDSGERAAFDSGMVRDVDTGKPDFFLCLPKGVPYEEQVITRWAALMTRGAEKYDKRNWEKASGPEELERFRSSAFRHFMQWLCCEEDEDHAVAVFFNIAGAERVKYVMGQNDSGN